MRGFLLGFLLFPILHAVGQESVPALGRASDGGQQVFDERINSPGTTASSQRIHAVDRIDVVPTYPGGSDSLLVALKRGCSGALVKANSECGTSHELVLRFIVEKDGRPTRGELTSADGCPVLVEALHCSMRELESFKPGMVEGQRVRVRMEVPITLGLY
ncbi:MAG: hypothetical protein WEC15_04960 [Flavobacteriales bacterium]